MFRSFILIDGYTEEYISFSVGLNPFVQVFYSNQTGTTKYSVVVTKVLIPLFRSFILMINLVQELTEKVKS